MPNDNNNFDDIEHLDESDDINYDDLDKSQKNNKTSGSKLGELYNAYKDNKAKEKIKDQVENPKNNEKKETPNKKNKIDPKTNFGANVLNRMGVPRPIASKAAKDNGGKFSPSNYGVMNKNRDRLIPNNNSVDDTNEDNTEETKDKKNSNDTSNKLNPLKNKGKKSVKDRVKDRFDDTKKENNKDEDDSQSPANDLIINLTGMINKKIIITIMAPAVIFLAFLMLQIVAFNITSDVTTDRANEITEQVDTIYDGNGNLSETDENYKFITNLVNIKKEYKNNGTNIDIPYIITVFSVIANNSSKELNDFTSDEIKQLVDKMYQNNSFDENNFKDQLKDFYKGYFPDYSDGKIDGLIDDTYSIYENYVEKYGKYTTSTSVCSSAGACSYDIKGFTNGNKKISKNINVNNLKVKLMQGGSFSGHSCGGTWGLELPNEELVDFEKYVLGVAYAESGANSYEGLKTQLVAARSYSLARADMVGNSYGRKLYEENGQWILQITNCVSDQVYCDPDKGCSKNVAPGNQWGNVHTGINNTITYKPPLAADAPLRQAAQEVTGEVLVGSNGYIISTAFTSTNQNRWKRLADSGSDYKQILLSDYSGIGATNILKTTCNTDGAGCNEVTGEYATWLQAGQSWSSIKLGTSNLTIGSSGCLATSIAILIAKTGVATNVTGSFNPGTFVQSMNSIGGIDSQGNLLWYKVSTVAPNFHFAGRISLSGKTREEKFNTIKNLLTQGYYAVVEVMGNRGQHWVAIDSVNGDNISMYDPASQSTDLWSQYNSNDSSAVSYFKVVR